MIKAKQRVGKGHTLFEDDLPKDPSDIWILLAESCYEISRTLLNQGSYAKELSVHVSGYEYGKGSYGGTLIPEGFARFPSQLFESLEACPEIHSIIETHLFDIRRVQVSAICEPYIPPLFHDESASENTFNLMNRIRIKNGGDDVIGLGFEGLRKRRISTYTNKRSDELLRARELLKRKAMVRRVMEA